MATLEAGPDLRRLREDFPYFCEAVLGLRLWKAQKKAAASKKFVTALAAPRRTGKSTLIEALAIWTCFRDPGARVLIVSSAEASAKDRIEEIQLMLARSEETRGSAVDEGKTRIDFRNGSVLMSRPASPKAIRGLGRDLRLLVLDEASLIDESIWTSAMFVAMDEKREGARIILADVPWGSREHWWRRQFELGTDKRHPDVESHQWTVRENPALDHEYLQRQRDVMPYQRYLSDIEGVWGDDEWSAFPHSLLMSAVADLEEVAPTAVKGLNAAAGLDFAFVRDSNALAVVAPLADLGLNEGDDERARFAVIYTEMHKAGRVDPLEFPRRVAETAQLEQGGHGFSYQLLASESNRVGQAPTMELRRRIRGRNAVLWSLHQTQEKKATSFGLLRSLVADGRLILPRQGELLRALGSISAKITETGGVRIEATTAGGSHGDLAFALANAMGPWARNRRSGCAITRHGNRPLRLRHEEAHRISLGPIVETGAGIRIPQRPYLADLSPVVGAPLIHRAGEEPFLAGYAHDNEGEME